ncbi:MAG TPA: TPM domain-containing protein [Saprospiraceae bacterium]|nr:TPM domain-containing protein [Saprospiraceae bacterium]
MFQVFLRRLGCLGLLLFLGASLLAQYTPESVPNPKRQGRGYVSNPDNIISPTDVARLNRLLTEMEDSTTAQVAVVIVQSIGGANPKDFAHELFNLWGIGQAETDNGLLVFTVMDQRRTEFETGYGLEGVLPDVVCYRIGMQELVPEFKEGRYGEGLVKAVERIKLTLEDPEAAEEISANPNIRSNPYQSRRMLSRVRLFLLIYGTIALLFTVVTVGRISNIIRSREELYDKYLDLRKLHYGIYFLLIPIPYILIYIFIRRRLKQLRYQPRYSRETGAPMQLISEAEEDAYLEAGQITEEEIGSVDYDVWATDEAEELMILRYKKRFTKYKGCPNCSYIAYYHAFSKTVKHPTYSSTGRKKVVHRCKNCNYEDLSYRTIPKKTRSSSSGGGSGGGSSSFGGGSSGGGGAGVSW